MYIYIVLCIKKVYFYTKVTLGVLKINVVIVYYFILKIEKKTHPIKYRHELDKTIQHTIPTPL